MHFRLARLLLVLSVVSGVAACSFPEAPAASANGKAPSTPHDRQIAREQSEIDRRSLQQQNEVLNDLQELREGRRGATELANDDTADSRGPKLLIFGGANHEVYLGCLCDGRNPESVFNLAGEYGSARSTTSMRNKRAAYGSSHED